MVSCKVIIRADEVISVEIGWVKLANLDSDDGSIGYGEDVLDDCIACIQCICQCYVQNLDWNALSDSYAKLAKYAPPIITKSSVSDIGTQLVSWGNSAKSNKKLSASSLQTLMKSTNQLQILTQGSVPTWSIGMKYSSAGFGKILVNYGNICHLGKVSATNVAAINGVLQQINSAKIF
ncbi:hypothetical protein BABINDRAFT_10070 [Babjeviella inositovora NRRL Y-12698]|uniref:Uncharacterized protein n=1 Tax=Babjeviella inositovora NRRL Y-12698 TaxID=984486 RepID=A0A1E3QK21_9ASCO|nr:uncharacterized protein BABINDRAFT_10070 [Babjeviella inositovora NRRL Y-12698]ODQ77422.1 hypothetical protein BABINDRAFT_10070 [Babjeviella inositovora NRRL Y-12698]